jgi:nitrous oxide reductase accessory protein NosL
MRLTTNLILQTTFVVLLISGCGKKDEQATPAPAPSAAMQGTPTVFDPNAGVDLAEMTRDVRRWILKNQRPPKDFADYAATATTPVPPAPAGKKFILTKQMSVDLVKK